MWYNDHPRLRRVNGLVYGPDVLFMQIVAQKQNAKLLLQEETSEDRHLRARRLTSLLINGKADVFTNIGLHNNTPRLGNKKLVNTFETDGFCARIPYPQSRFYFDFMFKPFDSPTWVSMIASMICCAESNSASILKREILEALLTPTITKIKITT